MIIPFAANIGVTAMVVSRVVLGFLLGASWPAIHPMTAVWIPPMDRSKFISNMMASALGAAITMPICGYLISWFGWPSVFYSTGEFDVNRKLKAVDKFNFQQVLSVFCGRCVGFCSFSKLPPNIREFPMRNEKKLKMQSVTFQPVASTLHRPNFTFVLGSSTSKKRPSYVPWKSILTSKAVWAIILVHGASVFGYFLVVNQLPGFMNDILKFDIKSNGLLSSLPYLGKYTMSVCASHFADHLRSTGKISTTTARKAFTTFAVAPPGIMFILLIFFGENATMAVIIFTVALTLNGAVTAGYLGNGLDIAPNFSGTIFGMANTLSSLGGYVSAWMVGVLTENNVSFVSLTYLTLNSTFIHLIFRKPSGNGKSFSES